jgi:hypothetical protein
MVLCNGKTAEALEKFSKLFTKITAAKVVMAKAKEQQNNLQTCPDARQAVPLPRVVDRPPIPASLLPRMPVAPAEADYYVGGVSGRVQIVGTVYRLAVPPMQIVESQSRLQIVENTTPWQGTHGPPIPRPNYISQNDDDEP